MDALLVDGDEIELTPDPPWMWMAPVRLSVAALPGHQIKAKGKFTIWDAELVQAGLLAAGKMYTAPGFATPGSVITCTIVVNPATMSKVYKDLKLPIATVATAGTFLAAVVPAVNPATGVPDPLVAKTGTWKVVTEKQSVAKSGQPKADATDGDEADAKAGDASGGNSAEPGANENKVHWVAVKYQDMDGNPLPEHRIAISTPDGQRFERKTTASGASRVDGIRAEGEAIASLLELSLRPGVKQPPVPFLGVTIVDEDGFPIEGIELGFTAPSGAELQAETNKKGSVRLDKLPELGTWTVKAVKLPEGLFDGFGSGDGNGATNGTDTSNGSGANAATSDDESTKRLSLLEVPDVLCRTSSCIILPEGDAPSDSTQHPAVSGVGIFAMAIRLCEERPEFKLLIAAHTDTVDTTDDNQVLSNERAQMTLAMLTGDRESYKKLAHARHRISDVKQMLHWCTRAYPDVFTCDPGPINDKDDTWNAVHTFERQYNECKFYFTSDQPDLELTGEMGPNNWGALFDVLQHNIAQELGVKVKEVAPLREKIKWLDDGRKALGFSEHHPIDAVGADNYESQNNRRVELLFFKETDILPDVGASESNPSGSEIYLPGIYGRERIEVVSAKLWRARWGATPLNSTNTKMVLEAPQCPADTELRFTVKLVGFQSSTVATALAAGELTEVAFSDFSAPDEVPFNGSMTANDEFPNISAFFTVEGGGRRISSAAAPFEDELLAELSMAQPEGEKLLAHEHYILATPWGNRPGVTDEKAILTQQRIPPGGFAIAARGRELFAVADAGKDNSEERGKSS
jgi:hypothetical protein